MIVLTILEIKGDLFNAPDGFYFAYCVSSDFALGAGIAKQFRDKFNMKEKLMSKYNKTDIGNIGKAILIVNCFNLVTKERYYNKPTYASVQMTLLDMKRQCIEKHITKLAMPHIAAGLDGLEWNTVLSILCGVFNDTNVIINIYSL